MAGERDRLVEQRLVFDDAADLEAAARRQDELRLGVVDAGRELVRGEAAEHHRVHRADARASEHGDHRFRHHGHIEDDAIALRDAEIAQDRGEHLRLHLQAVIADGALLTRKRGIVDDRRLLAAPAQDVAVDRVPAGVADAAGEPAPVDAGIGIEHLLGRFDPVDVPRRFAPKALRVALPARVDVVIAACAGIHGAAPSSLTASSRGTAARPAGGGRAHRPLFGAIVSARGAFASRAERTTRLCGKMLARAAPLRFDPNQSGAFSRSPLPKSSL